MKFAELLSPNPVLSDGAWGTEFLRQGLDIAEPADSWNLRFPDRVAAVARSYVDAGSRVILTNTFRANRITLAAAEIAAINQAGVEISREAAGPYAAVFASMGPSGKMLAAGEVTEAQLADVFGEQVEALAKGKPDAILIETLSDLDEARIALAAARATGLPVVASFVFDSGRNRDRTFTGVTPEQAATAMEAGGAAVVGANCGNGIDAFVPLARRMAAATRLPIWIKPNAGLPEIVDGEATYRIAPDDYARHLPDLVHAGAQFIGGCCGTNPSFIRALARQLDALQCASS